MKVTTKELRQVASLLFDHLEASEQTEFNVEEDFYWNIPQDELYDRYKEPSHLDLGQLTDDVDRLRKMMSDKSLCVGYGLVWLAAVLRRLGEMAEG